MRATRVMTMLALPAAAAAVLLGSVRTTVGAGDALTIVSRLQPQAERLWREIPEDAKQKSVRLAGGTPPECARAALAAAKAALSERQAGPLALRTLDLETELTPSFREGYGVGGGAEAEPVYDAYLRSDGADEFVGALAARVPARLRADKRAGAEQEARVIYDGLRGAASGPFVVRAGDAAGGTVWGVLDLRTLPTEAGRLQLSFAADGNGRCRAPADTPAPLKLSAWRVLGTAALEADGRSREDSMLTLKWKAKDPDYVVFAACGCADDDEREEAEAPAPALTVPAAAASVDPACGGQCQSLQGQVQQRLQDSAAASARAQRLEQGARRANEELEALRRKLEESAKSKKPARKPAKPKAGQGGAGAPAMFFAAAQASPSPKAPSAPRATSKKKPAPAPDPQLVAREQEAKRAGEAADRARRQADYLEQSAREAMDGYEACFRRCPPPRKTQVAQARSDGGVPKPLIIGGGAVLVGGGLILLGGGDDGSPEGGRPPTGTSPRPSPSPAASPSPSPSPSPSQAPPVDRSGNYGVNINAEADPGGHNSFIGLGRVTQVNVTATATLAGAAFQATGPSPWVAVVGTYDGQRFNATGRGTVAGRPNVGVSFTGTLGASGLNGQYIMGTGRELPGGQPITYRVIGTRSGP